MQGIAFYFNIFIFYFLLVVNLLKNVILLSFSAQNQN